MQTTAENKLAIQISEHHYSDILTPAAIEFLLALHTQFDQKRLELLENRKKVQSQLDEGHLPKFPVETENLRKQDWVAATIPLDLQDRRVEITGPVDRKMIINALNSGAKTFMADFEDSNSPTWKNNLEGQRNLKDAVNKTISIETTNGEKTYALHENPAVLIVRPRGLHLNEKNFTIGNTGIAGSLFDFGLYLFHNAFQLIANGSGPYFYLPKLEHYEEARWWNEVFVFSQNFLRIPQGTIKATVLIETITASFQLDEIIFELKEHIAGLNCGRWDYIFSYIKKFRNHKDRIVPDRSQVTMNSPFMLAYSQRVIQICHKRNVLAIGGMAAQIPIKNDEEANKVAFEKVRNDKLREVKNGHDGTWVAHPALVPVALEIFDEFMPTPNQIEVKREDLNISESDLIEKPIGTITEKGLRENINVGILYIESWLSGKGAAALYHLMEDAATAEISRTQVWQWLHADAVLDNGRVLNSELYKTIRCEEIKKIIKMVGAENFEAGNFRKAIELFDDLVLKNEFKEFLTLEAYKYLS
ncbi:malate synthase A [Moheibacter lacus]|uniref:Malate synthase n=1 Tax=Moheibacter lacus TaxID=2745851 RepID=A0A838ZSP5_9FLAO|nr:malate synthase A [Moheibacter lacus]MBA5629989.1 malate synthase A [Moheibacter lacus]